MHEVLDLRKTNASTAAHAPFMELAGVGKTYRTLEGAEVVAVSPTDLSVRPGEFLGVLGPSGCGKTTLLNLMTGLIQPTCGEIRIDGERLTGPSPEISLVFQRPILLPWRKVLSNVMLPIEILRLSPRSDYERTARDLIRLVGLGGFEDAYPRELSGGMQQRAAIARALVYDTRALLMDEPFAALDAMTREEMNIELMRIWKATGRTIVFVTHNIAEAVLLSDRIVVMTARPGQVREIVPVDLPRPRGLSVMAEPGFGRIVGHIRRLFEASHTREPADGRMKQS